MNHTILNPMNQCTFTGLEKLHSRTEFNDGSVEVYVDNFNKKRIVFKNGEGIVSALWLDEYGNILWKYTDENFRGQRLTRQLQCVCSLLGIKWKSSDNLTEAGKACYK